VRIGKPAPFQNPKAASGVVRNIDERGILLFKKGKYQLKGEG